MATDPLIEKFRTAGQGQVFAFFDELAPDGTGLILGPSHRMQSDIPTENVAAMLRAFPGAN